MADCSGPTFPLQLGSTERKEVEVQAANFQEQLTVSPDSVDALEVCACLRTACAIGHLMIRKALTFCWTRGRRWRGTDCLAPLRVRCPFSACSQYLCRLSGHSELGAR